MTNDSYPLLAGGELVRNERALLSRVECGSMMTSARAIYRPALLGHAL